MNTSNKLCNPVYIGVFLTSMAVLSLEVILTRIFSFSIWYHFAYLTISMALLGFGSSGAILAAYPKILEKARYRLLVIVSILSCILIIVSLLVFSRYPLQPDTLFSSPIKFSISLIIYYIGITLPFFFAGMAIAVSLAVFSEKVSYFYFWDLVGAGIGSLLSLLLINWLGAPGGVMVCALLMLIAACFFATQVSKRLTFILALLGLVFFSIIPYVKDRITVLPCNRKALHGIYQQPDTYKSLFSKWNAINRVDVYTNLNKAKSCWWCMYGISNSYKGTFPDVHTMVYDAHNGSNIYQFKGNLNEFSFLDYHMLKTPYLLQEKPKVLILGVGGGIDVFNALKNEASSITAIELQPITVSLLKGRFSGWTGDIFNKDKHINLIASEGRNFINRDKENYDLIQITSTDSFAALNTGAYVLVESYLYTIEAFLSYFDHLTEDGLLCIIVGDGLIKGGEGYQPLNSRLVLQYLEVLRARGIEFPQYHIAVLGKKYPTGLVMSCPLLKKTPFTEEDMIKLRSFAREIGSYLIYDPLAEKAPDNLMSKIIPVTKEESKRIIDQYQLPYNITPCTDNNPFFFSFIKWKNVFDVLNPRKFYFITPVFGQVILLVLFIQSIVFSFFFIILPLLTSKTTKFKLGKSFGYLFYFFSLGIGFMFIEISFIQKFVLFLGYPAYAFAITLFSLLLFSGLGSYWTSRLKRKPEDSIKRIFFILVPILLLYTWILPHLFDRFIGVSFFVKIFITMLTQMPLGFVLGMFFPLGIKLVNQVDTRMVPWAWGVNGMGSVVSSVLAIILAMSYGFNFISYLAIIVYLLGTSSILITKRALP